MYEVVSEVVRGQDVAGLGASEEARIDVELDVQRGYAEPARRLSQRRPTGRLGLSESPRPER